MNISKIGINEDFKLIDISNMLNEQKLIHFSLMVLVEAMLRYHFYSKKKQYKMTFSLSD
ncbi:hypothetical protein CJ739_3002 [Mariniflexile rhizosphaerae]|nr:hypothetical protein CJ739_3002 [Mariniflexile sp. TRM1-10]PLB20295.1 MAG: hypothetical protein TRG1_944 [Flavobacteriaceae bacterium FS1-H7996/R]